MQCSTGDFLLLYGKKYRTGNGSGFLHRRNLLLRDKGIADEAVDLAHCVKTCDADLIPHCAGKRVRHAGHHGEIGAVFGSDLFEGMSIGISSLRPQ